MHSQGDTHSCPDLFYARNQPPPEEIAQDSASLVQDETAPIATTPSELTLDAITTTLNGTVEKLKNEISTVIDKKVVSCGIWDAQLRLVKIVDSKSLKQYPPHHVNNCPYLFPFEALFLLECRTLSISYENITLSIEDCYKLLLSDKRHSKLYRIFSTLSKNGYYVRECCEQHSDPITEPNKDENLKHLIESEMKMSSFESRKRLKQETLNSKQESALNYKVMTSIRPLSMGHLRKLSSIDKKLQACCEADKPSNSILYCLRDSAIPVEMNKRLLPLWGHDDDLKPLVGLSAIHNTAQLFELMQNAGPKSSHPGPDSRDEGESDIELRIDFEVFRSRADSALSAPLFRVVVVDQKDSLPSSSTIRQLQSRCSSPLFFALISNSLEFNFYGLENITIEKQYPHLWEKYYA